MSIGTVLFDTKFSKYILTNIKKKATKIKKQIRNRIEFWLDERQLKTEGVLKVR